MSTIVTTINSYILPLIRESLTSLQVLRSSLGLLLALMEDVSSNLQTDSLVMGILPRLFVLAFVMPHCSLNEEEMEVAGLAEKLWNCWKCHSDSQSCATVIHEVKGLLRDLLPSTDVRPR